MVCGPVSQAINKEINLIKVTSASEMYDACVGAFDDVDIAVMSAAVADYTVSAPATERIKKQGETLVVNLQMLI